MSSECIKTSLPNADDYIAWLVENLRHEWLTPIMHGLSNSLSEPFLITLFSLLYWCWRKPATSWLILMTMSCVLLNMQLKEWFNQCRPLLETRLQSPHDLSFPSGHAQLAILLWGWLAYQVKKLPFTIFSAFMIVGISLSRNYLGVHYAHDVMAGLIVGGILLSIFIFAFRRWPNMLNQSSPYYQVVWGLSLVLLPWILILRQSSPAAIELSVVIASALFALQWDARTIQFQPITQGAKATIAILIGSLGLILLQTLGTTLLMNLLNVDKRIIHSILYLMIVLWIFYFAPFCFIKLKLNRS